MVFLHSSTATECAYTLPTDRIALTTFTPQMVQRVAPIPLLTIVNGKVEQVKKCVYIWDNKLQKKEHTSDPEITSRIEIARRAFSKMAISKTDVGF